MKRTVIANVLFSTIHDLVTAFQRGVRAVNAKLNKMGFLFDHDDVTGKMAA